MKVLEGATLEDRGLPPEGEPYPQRWLRVKKGVRVKVALRKEEG
jgi:hypothetical protein